MRNESRRLSLLLMCALVGTGCLSDDSATADSTAAPLPSATATTDSARLAFTRDSLVRDSIARDSLARADSLRPRSRYRAVGQEPGWLLVIEDTVLTLRWNYDERRATVRTPEAVTIPGGRQWTHRDSTLTFTITARDTACADVMSGRPYPERVTVQIGRNTRLEGCGGDPTRSLLGAEWRIDTIGTTAVDTSVTVTLTFGDDERAFGLTGCNNYSAMYTLRNDTVVFAPAIVTKRACAPPRGSIEQQFLAVLADTVVTVVRGDGRLEVRGGARRMIGRR